MSYLDLPRLHFGGLFFTNPDTINNYIGSFDPDTKLLGPDGAYLSDPQQGGGPSGWNPPGVAQLWIEGASVLSAVDADGRPAASDPVLGAPVESPSPKTPKKTRDGKGLYDIAKMVDLDPQMQTRSAVYGLRLFVTLPGGGGFSGPLTVPELQYLSARVPAQTGSWAAVGTWMGWIESPDWFGDLSASPFLAAFREACPDGVAVKLTVDLHQNDPATRFTAGNQFCYGRVLGTLGPVRPGDLPQAWAGRRLVPVSSGQATAAPAAAAEAAPSDERSMARTLEDEMGEMMGRMMEQVAGDAPSGAPEALAAEGAPPLPWNPVPAQVSEAEGQALLHADLGGSILLQFTQDAQGIFASNGKFVVDTGITVGVRDPETGSFRAFDQGEVDLSGQYRPLDSQAKTVNLLANCGVVDVPLTAEEARLAASTPLAIQVNGTQVVAEPDDGVLMALSGFSARLEEGGTASLRLTARRFGRPLAGVSEPAKVRVRPASSGGLPGDLAFTWEGPTDEEGIARLTVTATDRTLTLPPLREPLDSLVYLVTFVGPNGPIGDAAFRSQRDDYAVLLFNAYEAPAKPTWEDDVGPILQAYARLYPGMQDRLDIADEATVKGFAPALYGRMAAPFDDPAFMPVTRDLSPARIEMILDWLRPLLPKQGS
jgi:hypothetical protein